MTDVSEAIIQLYKETSGFILLGLTGRTGSGCSTVAEVLAEEEILASLSCKSSEIFSSDASQRKYQIVHKYICKNLKPFKVIQVRTIITSILLELSFKDFVDFIAKIFNKESLEISKSLNDFQELYEENHKLIKEYKKLFDNEEQNKEKIQEKAWDIYFKVLPTFSDHLKKILQENLDVDAYTLVFQKAGDNIRASGVANKSEFDSTKIFIIAQKINKLIKIIRKRDRDVKQNSFIVIDAIRNPFEAIYFHQRYAAFYLVAINTPNEERLKYLRENRNFSHSQIKALDKKEYPESLKGKDVFISQNIQKCIEIADIHIHNPKRYKNDRNELRRQLYWYIALILHPGLVTPTSIERCMQLAFSAKLNSGCISRQVGAVVTDENFSVKAVGWNNTPEGQVPCLLRSAETLLNSLQPNDYSLYEKNNDSFRKVLEDTYMSVLNSSNLNGRNLSYCFKDLQNEVEGDKNQVHTRSLHAEENAFLQLAKYGGEPIEGGILFSTASPCELCSKKAYQLGIQKIVFIDPYPGISKEHILTTGSNLPELILFRGALGRAYHRLYQPAMAFKDELQMLTNYSIKGGKKEKQKDLENENLKFEDENKALKDENLELKKKIEELERNQRDQSGSLS